jgi:hypothetical protein
LALGEEVHAEGGLLVVGKGVLGAVGRLVDHEGDRELEAAGPKVTLGVGLRGGGESEGRSPTLLRILGQEDVARGRGARRRRPREHAAGCRGLSHERRPAEGRLARGRRRRPEDAAGLGSAAGGRKAEGDSLRVGRQARGEMTLLRCGVKDKSIIARSIVYT